MQLTVLGSSGTYPTAGRPASGYLVSHEGTTLWMEAGPGTYAALCMEMDPAELDGVFLSHRHPDHCVDVFALFHAMAYGGVGSGPLPVIVPEGLADSICAFVEGSADAMNSVFSFQTLADGERTEVGSLSLTVARTNHPPPTIAPRIEAGGKTLTYTADTGPSDAVAALGEGSDLLLSEAALGDPRHPDSYLFHLTGVEAGAMATKANARRLVLTHIAPTLDPNQVVAGAESQFDGQVSIAFPGSRVTV